MAKSNNILETIIDAAEKRGHEVRIRDVAYALMCVEFGDDKAAFMVAYQDEVIGQNDAEIAKLVKARNTLKSIKYLIGHFKQKREASEKKNDANAEIIAAIAKSKSNDNGNDSIAFEENRAGIEQQIREILDLKKLCVRQDAEGNDITDVKTMALLQKTEADLRSKLNDKFGASEKSSEQYVVVQPRFNHICEHTRKECWLMTEEFAMAHWHLIPDPDYNE